jgi:hypothetical protein
MKASSATKITQISQLAANAASRQSLDEASSSITITGMMASVATRAPRFLRSGERTLAHARFDVCRRDVGYGSRGGLPG